MSGIDKIGGLNSIPSLFTDNKNNASSDFSSFLNEALDSIQQTDTADKVSNLEMLAGDGETLHGTLIEAEKADLALRLTLQVRNKVVDAYNEVMRMQV